MQLSEVEEMRSLILSVVLGLFVVRSLNSLDSKASKILLLHIVVYFMLKVKRWFFGYESICEFN
ncbi:hypothetical protein [Nostoc sp. WHI]|uniref:hypothetical protein n=1 Tax=Nostoc sp. WHI TaxID=2650611 RepID=UPI0018C45E30|nr:hypothetical protein [Nostoc sp. WHI]MBG1267346.1 hypothetical protein [Nostoc sp. WHI]